MLKLVFSDCVKLECETFSADLMCVYLYMWEPHFGEVRYPDTSECSWNLFGLAKHTSLASRGDACLVYVSFCVQTSLGPFPIHCCEASLAVRWFWQTSCWLRFRLPFGFAVNFASLIPTFSLHSGFAFICPFGLTFRFPQSFAFGFTFHFVQASPSVPVFKSSVPSDFASLENLSRLHSVPSFRLSCSLRSHANRLRLIHPDLKESSL